MWKLIYVIFYGLHMGVLFEGKASSKSHLLCKSLSHTNDIGKLLNTLYIDFLFS